MTKLKPILIDSVQSNTTHKVLDTLSLEWFETRKKRFTRNTDLGITLELIREDTTLWQHNDILYANKKCIAKINIKPCLVIQCLSIELTDVADFCYFVSNRHLPIFFDSDTQICTVPYDGKLFEQLLPRFGAKILLTESRLLDSNEIKNKFKNQ